MRRWHLIVFFLTLGSTASLFYEHVNKGALSILYCILAIFLWTNLLICVWEICLAFRIDHIADRHAQNLQNFRGSKLQLVSNVFNQKAALREVFCATFWSDIWMAYAVFDPSYADRKSFGFFIDIGNGVSTLIPTIIWIIGIATPILPARVLGIIGVILFYQVLYGTILYLVSFVFNKRYRDLTRLENFGVVALSNAIWIIFPALGIYTSIRLILDNNYALLSAYR